MHTPDLCWPAFGRVPASSRRSIETRSRLARHGAKVMVLYWFRVQNLGFRVQGLGFRVQSFGFRFVFGGWGLEGIGSGFRVVFRDHVLRLSLGCRANVNEFRGF